MKKTARLLLALFVVGTGLSMTSCAPDAEDIAPQLETPKSDGNQGYDDGHADGYNTGYEDGHNDGYDPG